MRVLLAALALAACSNVEARPEPRDPADPIPALYVEAADRAVEMLDEHGMVVCYENGEAACKGDSLIFSGLAMFALDCTRANVIDDALRAMLGELGGGLWRHPDRSKEASLDGALGLYRGVQARIQRCYGARSSWAASWRLHLAFLAATRSLNPSGDGEMPLDFDAVPDAIGAELGLNGRVSQDRINSLAFEVAVWADAVVSQQASAYRIHLGLIALQTLEALGYEVGTIYRNRICHVTRGADLATVDHWCGRGTSFVETFAYDAWEFRLQRAAWEGSPDGNGRKTAAIDLLVYMRDVYSLPE